MKYTIDNMGTATFPYYVVNEDGKELFATSSFETADRIVKLLILPHVSQRSELLSNFASYLNETYNLNIEIDNQDVESFLKIAL